MINYDEHIEARDIVNYWSKGIVLLRHKGSWSGYKVSDVRFSRDEVPGSETITLRLSSKALTHGDPPEKVELSRQDFFKRAVLHRPRLGVVKDGKKMVLLSWAPGRGDMNKAIQPSDIVCKILFTSNSESTTDEWRDRYRKAGRAWALAIREMRTDRHYPEDYRGSQAAAEIAHAAMIIRTDAFMYDTGIERRSKPVSSKHLTLAVKFLNFKPTTLRSAYDKCMKSGSAIIRNTLWLEKNNKDSTVRIVNGDNVIGCLSKTLQHHPIFDRKNPKLSLINRKILDMLMTQMEEK